MSTKNILLIVIGAVIVGVALFFALREKTEAPTVDSFGVERRSSTTPVVPE